MDVQETRLREVLQGQTQYRVPLYQRPYSWTLKQLERIWADILELAEAHLSSPSATHFTGSLVLSTGQIGPNGTEFLVVDGQQRLTTLSILIAALRDHYADTEPDNPARVARLEETFLVDRFKQGDARLKLLPTQADRPAYRSIVAGAIDHSMPSGLLEAYRFFRTKLRLADDPDDPHDIPRIEGAVLNGLVFVAITAKGDDNVYRIFESLNNTGMKLTQGDLLRNYMFMRAGDRGDEVYDTWWLPMQKILSADDLEALFWIDLIWRNPDAKAGDIYSGQVERLRHFDQQQVIDEVKRFKRLAELFAVYRDPDLERDARVAKHLRRVKSWGIGSMDVLVLFWLRLRDDGVISDADTADALHLIESFLVRRIIVGAPANSLPKIFNRAITELGDDPTVGGLRRYFTVGRKFFATDAQVTEAVLAKPFYYQGRPHQRKTVLAWLEEVTPISFLGAERPAKEHADISSASIEHIMPQSLSPAWRDDIAGAIDDARTVDEVHEELLHTLANLTLTAYNSELSNRPFTEKRELLESSGLRMNHQIASHSTWGPREIRERGRVLAERIVRTWVGPVAETDSSDSGVSWKIAADAVAAIPAGRWASYGDVAAIAGTHPVPLGQFLATKPVLGAYRVLQAAGTVSPGFSWGPGSALAGEDVHELLRREGIEFDSEGRASQDQRMQVSELAEFIGLSVRSDVEPLTEEEGAERAAFLTQLAAIQAPSTVHGVIELVNAWERLGGHLSYGSGEDLACILQATTGPARPKHIWPIALYASGATEVGFQYLVSRPPFDEPELREELRERLSRAKGVDLPGDKLNKRPSFPLDVLADRAAREQVLEALEWFMSELDRYDAEMTSKQTAA